MYSVLLIIVAIAAAAYYYFYHYQQQLPDKEKVMQHIGWLINDKQERRYGLYFNTINRQFIAHDQTNDTVVNTGLEKVNTGDAVTIGGEQLTVSIDK